MPSPSQSVTISVCPKIEIAEIPLDQLIIYQNVIIIAMKTLCVEGSFRENVVVSLFVCSDPSAHNVNALLKQQYKIFGNALDCLLLVVQMRNSITQLA